MPYNYNPIARLPLRANYLGPFLTGKSLCKIGPDEAPVYSAVKEHMFKIATKYGNVFLPQLIFPKYFRATKGDWLVGIWQCIRFKKT